MCITQDRHIESFLRKNRKQTLMETDCKNRSHSSTAMASFFFFFSIPSLEKQVKLDTSWRLVCFTWVWRFTGFLLTRRMRHFSSVDWSRCVWLSSWLAEAEEWAGFQSSLPASRLYHTLSSGDAGDHVHHTGLVAAGRSQRLCVCVWVIFIYLFWLFWFQCSWCHRICEVEDK